MLDIIIIIFILFGALLGFKRGFTKELVNAIGLIVVIIFAYILKNPVSTILYENLPFFEFGMLKNVEILNILIYETIAFILCFIVLLLVLRILFTVSSIFEKILNATIILSIPSKLLGALVGIIYHFVLAFVIVYIISLIFIDSSFINDSRFSKKILTNTPLLSNLVEKSINTVDEFIILKDKYNDKSISENEFNYQAIKLFLKYDIISIDSLQKLFDNGKIEKFDGYDELLKGE